MPVEFPKLRPLEVFPVQSGGKTVVCFQDPLKYCESPVFLRDKAYFIASLCDGTNSLRDIQAEYMRRFDELIYMESIEAVVNELDSKHLLESDGFRAYCGQVECDFRSSKTRHAFLAGKAYDADPETLRAQIDGFYLDPEGPGLPNGSRKDKRVTGLIAPHIDFQRGGACFAYGYKELAESEPADLYVILGVAHVQTQHPFILTNKEFDTPFGTVPVDSDAVEQLAGSSDTDFFADELVHRTEHSIEFQTVFLKHVLQQDDTPRILPILCSTPDVPPDGKEPAAEEAYASFATNLREIVYAREKTCVIAGVDLSHIGPRFGAVQRVGQDDLEDAEQHDRHLLGFVEKIDASGFYDAAMRDGNRRNVCGVGPIYLLLQTVRASKVTILKYEQAYDPNGTVTFASACFTP